jgi:hypothetical protein
MDSAIKSGQEETKATVITSQENIQTAINSIWSSLKETIEKQAEDMLLCVDPQTQYLCEH